MQKKKFSIIFVLLLFALCTLFLLPSDKSYRIEEVYSPASFKVNNQKITLEGLDYFDSYFSAKNKTLAKELNITETEAFIMGNLSKYWVSNLMKGRKVQVTDDDFIFLKYSYKTKFMYSGFCIINSKPVYPEGFERKLKDIKHGNYKVLDLDTETVYLPHRNDVESLKNYLVVRNRHLPRKMKKHLSLPSNISDFGDIKIYFADSTSKLRPDRECSEDICKEILTNINNAKNSIDMAIYGYSRVPKIEAALKSAQQRGVKIRLVYDLDAKGENIYPDTKIITDLIKDNKSDVNSVDAKNIMHNKFYIFDDKILITGSANLSHTDMSGFNTNSIVVINSSEAAKIYKNEFEQMYNGKFHSEKKQQLHKKITLGTTELGFYFSPQDKSITNVVLPLINDAKEYIYIPTFVLTEKRVTEALIKAQKRGVDVKIIIDALNASVQHSKHKELRAGGVQVKTENYAGKMHSKSMIVDGKYTIIGSMNFSYSGENRNDENLVLINNPEIANSYKDFFLYQWNKIDNKWLKLNARAEGKDSIGSCSDGLDNNYDGLSDSDDPACK